MSALLFFRGEAGEFLPQHQLFSDIFFRDLKLQLHEGNVILRLLETDSPLKAFLGRHALFPPLMP